VRAGPVEDDCHVADTQPHNPRLPRHGPLVAPWWIRGVDRAGHSLLKDVDTNAVLAGKTVGGKGVSRLA